MMGACIVDAPRVFCIRHNFVQSTEFRLLYPGTPDAIECIEANHLIAISLRLSEYRKLDSRIFEVNLEGHNLFL